jgi:ComF family protein
MWPFVRPDVDSPVRLCTATGLQVVALGAYAEPLAGQIRALKYQEETHFAARLGRRLARHVPDEWRDAVLLPVPLHPARLVERGYNQAALVARAVGRTAQLAVEFELLRRTKQTTAQARLAGHERRRNTADAFSVQARRSPGSRAGFVLVDDVVTTGATLEAARGALWEAGYRVWGALALAAAGQDALLEAR